MSIKQRQFSASMFHSFHEHFVPFFLATKGQVPQQLSPADMRGFFSMKNCSFSSQKAFFSVESTSKKEPPLRVLWMTPSNSCLLPYSINQCSMNSILLPRRTMSECGQIWWSVFISITKPSRGSQHSCHFFLIISTLYLIFRIPIYLFQYLCYQQFTLDISLAILSLLPYLMMLAHTKNTILSSSLTII